LEIGVYSGGSLGMWRQYFGADCLVYGVDIEPACKAYEADGIRVFIGDQAIRSFWGLIRQEVPRLDIVIDDGGHTFRQQIVTLEETLPHLHPGGVYVCEDILGSAKGTVWYLNGLVHHFYAGALVGDLADNERRLAVTASAFQASIDSVHVYPFVTVIEKRDVARREFVAPKRGSQWGPHL
jgi:Methyltransferase domain